MRLTHKHKYREDNKRYVFDMEDYHKVCQKLGLLENIEDELGIDLITLFKLFKADNVWGYGNVGKLQAHIDGINIIDKKIELWNGVSHLSYPFSEYGKSFALTEGELK